MLNRYVFVFVGIGVLYIVLLLMLVHVEKNVPGSNIHNLGQAIWYSLATFTTVGYGDLYPVSGWGRVVASVFLILGIGLLSFFVGFMVEFIARVRPIIILTTHADKPWYIFTDRSPHAVIFAENLKQVRPDALIIYAETKSENAKSSKELAVLWTVDELVQKRGSLYDLHIMCMKENEMENFLDAVRLAEIDVPIICLANFMPSHYPMNINFFSLKDCTARVFWQQYPVEKKDETIILIGFGQAGHMLLDRGLELNVLYKDQNIRYHVFGQGDDYCLNRKLLSDFVSINEESNER
ncbi:MAG: potassium channel family protein, partial [Lachnospiraceae bacterium]|nr:potassium channel family protein [Lachnospiraceae bacterium]